MADDKIKPLRGRLALALVSTVVTYWVLGNLLWIWNHRLSPNRLSTPEEIRQYHDRGYSYGLYRYHPTRQTTLRADNRAERHGMEGLWMHTDSRGLAYLPSAGQGERTLLVLGDSVAFGSWMAYGQSFPGVLAAGTDLQVFSGATESYSLRQTHDLFLEVGGQWDQAIYVWVPNDFYEWRFRETPRAPRPRAGLAPPLDLFDLRDLRWRFLDLWADPPEGVSYDEALAWSRHRYGDAFRRIEDMASRTDLVVVLTYLKPQLRTGRFEPQEWMKEGLDALGVPYVDTLAVYRDDIFVQAVDNVHFSPEGSVEWSELVLAELRARGWLAAEPIALEP